MSFLDRSLSEHTDRAKPPRHRSLNVWRDASLLVLVAVTVLVLLTFRDYGITNDEEVQNVYGKLLLEFYRSGDLAALDYLDLYRYGGLFDMLAALLNKVSPLGEYETRHLLGGLVGVLGLMGVWKLGRELAGERAGFLALMMFLLTPAFYGTSFNNPKDAPFAGAMAWTLYYMVRMAGQLPRPRLITVLKFGAAWGITLGIRVGAVLVLPYLSLAFLLYLVMVWRRNRLLLEVRAEAWRLIKLMLPAFALAYVLMAAFWPWAAASPLNPLRALSDFSRLPLNLDTLVAGQWVKATDLPPYYLPLYLAGKLPEMILVGLLAALGMGISWLLRPHHSEKEQRVTLQYMLVALAGFFPVIYFVLERPTAYNGLRHFLFVVPPMAVLAAMAFDRLWKLIAERSAAMARTFCVLVTVVLVVQAWIMVHLHPDEYVYFNQFFGGVKGAEDDFELDYWGNSLREATEELAHFLEMENGGTVPPNRTYQVAVCGHPLSATYYFPPFMVFTKKLDQADFLISFTQADCDTHFDGRQIVSVERLGAELSVVKDRRYLRKEHQPEPPATAPEPQPVP